MNKITTKLALFLITTLSFAAIPAFAGEIAESDLKKVTLGMRRDQIESVLGAPNRIRPDGRNSKNQIVEGLEYEIIGLPGASGNRSAQGNGGSWDRGGAGQQPQGPESSSPRLIWLITVDGIFTRFEKQTPGMPGSFSARFEADRPGQAPKHVISP